MSSLTYPSKEEEAEEEPLSSCILLSLKIDVIVTIISQTSTNDPEMATEYIGTTVQSHSRATEVSVHISLRCSNSPVVIQ